MDDLGLNWYAQGYELTYDIGYGISTAHTHVGWANQTVSHCLVCVNETSQMATGRSGGSVHLFADLGGLKLVEASSEGSYEGENVNLYRRTVAVTSRTSTCSTFSG
jgi:hypothetical protein